MDTRYLNTMNHTKGKITKIDFEDFERLRNSRKINMFGYNPDIQRKDNYSKCYHWFIEKKLEDDLNINIITGEVEYHLQEQEDGSVIDPLTGFIVFEIEEIKQMEKKA